MRKPFIAANWKMNKTVPEALEFLSVFAPTVKNIEDVTIVIAAPFTVLSAAAEAMKDTNIALAAQNMYFEEKGAYTGEISPFMLADIGCKQVIVGHSERRQYFCETDSVINRKIKAARKWKLGVIFCIGESLSERETGKTFGVLQSQLDGGLEGVDPADIVVAYEPVWAIGTGKTATPEQAQDAHAYIRATLKSFYGKKAEELCIVYGGSVTPENIGALMECGDIDGALVGGASLKAESFAGIVKFRKEK